MGLDVNAETIAVAVAEGGRDGQVRSLGTIANRIEAIRKLVKKLRAKARSKPVMRPAPQAIAPTGSWRKWKSNAK